MTKTPSATPSVSVEGEEYVLVPREPTREMVDAGRIYGWDDPEHEASCIGHPETRESIYRAMIAAAPNPTPDFVQVPYDDFHSAYGHVPRSKMSPYRCLKTRLRSLLRAEDLDHADEAEALAAAPAPNPSPEEAVKLAHRVVLHCQNTPPEEAVEIVERLIVRAFNRPVEASNPSPAAKSGEAEAVPNFVYSSVMPKYKEDNDEIEHLECWITAKIIGDDQTELYARAEGVVARIAALATPSPQPAGAVRLTKAERLLDPDDKNGPPQPLMHPNAEWCESYERWHRRAVRFHMERGSPHPGKTSQPADAVREAALMLTADEQHALATALAANVGYDLTPEPPHPDAPGPGAFEAAAERALAASGGDTAVVTPEDHRAALTEPALVTIGNPATEEEWQDRNGLSSDETSEPAPAGEAVELATEVKAWLVGHPATGQWIEVDGRRVEYARGMGTPAVVLAQAFKVERDRAAAAERERNIARSERDDARKALETANAALVDLADWVEDGCDAELPTQEIADAVAAARSASREATR